MTYFENESLWWSSLSAIGQLLGALATFLAVVVSLYLSRKNNTPNLQIRSKITNFNNQYLLELTVFNAGKIAIPLESCFF